MKLYKKRSGALILATYGWTLRTPCSVREGDTEGHTGCDSTDGKWPEQADPQTQRVGSCLSEAGEVGRANREGLTFEVMECSGTK